MKVMTDSARTHQTVEVAQAVKAHRDAAADAIARAFELMPRWHALAESESATRTDYVETHFGAFVDYLALHFKRQDPTYQHLLVGEMIKALYSPELDHEAGRAQSRGVLARQRELLSEVFRDRLSAEGRERFEAFLAAIEATLTRGAARTQRVLLVGDCLFLDIVPFVVPGLLEDGIELLPDYITSKNPQALREQIVAFSDRKFDLVFFSPFTYDFSPEYAQLAEWRNALTKSQDIRQVVAHAWEETRKTIDLLADVFDCPVHVHNSSAVIREESSSKRLVKQRATAKVRGAAKEQVNRLVVDHLRARNAATFQHLFLFDEDALVAEVGEHEAGAFLHRTALQHPAVLGRILARRYHDIIFVNASLMKRKVVVCDLDNTLWDGVIGEGEVAHFHDRQRILKSLRQKGVVLAINSKNDPANVHWRGGTLGDADFVHSAVSWNAKVQGMRQIQAALNLKTKDYVFIDDREDERELMRITYPEILCLDATDPTAWSRLALWEQALEADPDMDRTLMYQQREQRKAFVQEDVIVPESERAALFANLGLTLTIRRAESGDLKRATELINRTNQFNLEGSRTSLREMREWHESPNHLILLGQSADRFGEMGTTCVAVASIEDDETRLLPFVLSCRVFGYGIEYGVMEELKRFGRERGARRVVGRYVATPQNMPCRDFLKDCGLVEEDGRWIGSLDAAGRGAPEWLKVTVIA